MHGSDQVKNTKYRTIRELNEESSRFISNQIKSNQIIFGILIPIQINTKNYITNKFQKFYRPKGISRYNEMGNSS